jgi:hypothetical protein
MSFSSPQNAKIFMYLLNKNSNSSIQNEKSQKNNNSFIKNDIKYNNTVNSLLLKAITSNKVSKTNNSLISSHQQQSNSQTENKTKNTQNKNYNELLNSKEMVIINESNQLVKSHDNINIKNNNANNMCNDINLRATFSNNAKCNYDINNNYFLKEEFIEKLNSVRKIYKEREIKRQNIKCFYYLIFPGNASYLVEKCMNHRINWMKPYSAVTTLFNFKWQELSCGIDYDSLGHFQNIKQIVNHYENHFVISNKAKMFANLLNYCEKRKISVFKYVPFTIVFQLKDEKPKKTENDKKNNNINNNINSNNINANNVNNNNSNEDDKYEKLKGFLNNANKYIVKYNDLGNYYEKESYRKYVRYLKMKEKEKESNVFQKDYRRIAFRRKARASRKINKRKHLSLITNQKKESFTDVEKNNSNYTFYSNYFNNLIEDNTVPIFDKNKEFKDNNKSGEKNNVEPYIIGSNTIIEIPESHFTGRNMWVVKAINLNRGMCIRIVNTYEQMLKVLNKFKEGVDYNFTKEKIDENETTPLTKNNTINSNNSNFNISVSPSKKAITKTNSIDKEKIIRKNITANFLNSADKAKIANSNSIIKNFEKNNKPKIEEDKKNSEKEEKLYNCNRIIIQKYIEDPLLYRGRKCDMRIWVLLTHTMKVYVFKEGHLKTCSIEYNLNSKDAFAHITNYSFQKYNKNFQKYEKGNEVPFYEFQKFLDENYSERKYNLKVDLLNQVKEIVKITMRSAKNTINKKNRNFQFEIYGYDFMMDKDFNLFLIEINTNPGLEESSPWIKLIVPRMLDDALRLTIDQLFETKYDFNLINKNKTKEEINNYKKMLNNYKQNIDINGINTSSSFINITDVKQEDKNDNNSHLKTIPTINEKCSESEEKENIEKKDNDKNLKEEIDNKDNTNKDNNDNKNKDKKDNKNSDINKNKKYISPFPIPGYTLDENIWDFVCDLNEHDPFDEYIDKEEEISIENNNKKNNYNLFRKRRNKKGKKKKLKLNKISNNQEEKNEDLNENNE